MRGLRQEAVREVGAEHVAARVSSSISARSHSSNVIVSSARASGWLHGASGSSSFASASSFASPASSAFSDADPSGVA